MRDCSELQEFREFRRNRQNNQNSQNNQPQSPANFTGLAQLLDDDDDDTGFLGRTYMAKNNSPISDDDWVFDTGAARSMTMDKEKLTDYHSLITPKNFEAADGGSLVAHGYGTACICMEHMDVYVERVFYVPTVTTNLISAYGMSRSGYFDSLQPDLSRKITDRDGNLAGFADPVNGFYIINTRKPQIFSAILNDPLYLWHLRLGHVNYQVVSQITKIPSRFRYPPCHPCLASKQTKQRCTEPQTRATRILELIHMDLGGYYTPSQDGYRFFLIIVDDYTRYIWVWFLTTKNMQATSAALLQWKKLCGKSIRM